MAYAQRGGTKLYYEDSGGNGPAVIFSHGILMDHEMFAPQVEALAGDYRRLTWDERYHGATETEGSFTYWDSAEDLFAILDHAGIERAALVGMSQGGFLSLRAALLRPERVWGLFLIDTQAGTEEESVAELYRSWAQAWAMQGPQDHLIQATVPLIVSPAPADKWVEKWRSWPPEHAVPRIDALLAREDITSRLGEVSCPAAVVHGTDDPSIPMEKAEALCAGLPTCNEVVAIPGGGHAANLSHADEVNHALRSFLESLLTR